MWKTRKEWKTDYASCVQPPRLPSLSARQQMKKEEKVTKYIIKKYPEQFESPHSKFFDHKVIICFKNFSYEKNAQRLKMLPLQRSRVRGDLLLEK